MSKDQPAPRPWDLLQIWVMDYTEEEEVALSRQGCLVSIRPYKGEHIVASQSSVFAGFKCTRSLNDLQGSHIEEASIHREMASF